jgi:small-conductance mechanosensitive channel
MELLQGSFLGIRIWTLVASAAILALVGVADVVLRWLVRRKIRRDEASAAGATAGQRERLQWLDRGLRAAVPPLALLIWVIGLHAAVSLVLAELASWTAASYAVRVAAWGRDAGLLAAMLWLAARLGRVLEQALAALGARTSNAWDDALLGVAGSATRVLLPIVALILGAQAITIPAGYQDLLRTSLTLVLIVATAFVLYRSVEAAEAVVLQRYRIDVRDNLEARSVYTQVKVIKKIATAIIAVFTLASMLMVFESVRQFGTSILASAGIAGLIVGLAAQRSIATMLAGLQIAITQPIRLDDVVIVENEWGRIEDITLTFVTVRIWDERRLIVPITYFLERPFQNWTQKSAQLLATVFLQVDYRAPLEAIRQELGRILKESRCWDGRVNVLQVTEARERTMEIRALASAADASLAWDLRCEVREKLIQFLQRHYPESLPRVRAELEGTSLRQGYGAVSP